MLIGIEFDRHSLWGPANRRGPGHAQCGRVRQETKSMEPPFGNALLDQKAPLPRLRPGQPVDLIDFMESIG